MSQSELPTVAAKHSLDFKDTLATHFGTDGTSYPGFLLIYGTVTYGHKSEANKRQTLKVLVPVRTIRATTTRNAVERNFGAGAKCDPCGTCASQGGTDCRSYKAESLIVGPIWGKIKGEDMSDLLDPSRRPPDFCGMPLDEGKLKTWTGEIPWSIQDLVRAQLLDMVSEDDSVLARGDKPWGWSPLAGSNKKTQKIAWGWDKDPIDTQTVTYTKKEFDVDPDDSDEDPFCRGDDERWCFTLTNLWLPKGGKEN